MPDSPSTRRASGQSVVLTLAAIVVMLAGLRAAADVLTPVLVAVFLAVLSVPPVQALQRRGLPSWASVLIVFVGLLVAVGLVSFFVGASIQGFLAGLPAYQARMVTLTRGVLEWLEGQGVAQMGIDISEQAFLSQINAGALMGMTGAAIGALGSVLSNILFVLLAVGFILAEATSLPAKVRLAFEMRDGEQGPFTGVLRDLQTYLTVKTQVSIVTGVLAGSVTWLVGVDYPLLWGLVAFLLNYVPTLGSIIASVPPVLLALISLGWQQALIVLVAYVVINILLGNVLEPRLMGRKLGLSPLFVLLSLVFWGFIWGPVGMVLSVPLTMIVKILLEHSDDMRWLAVLLGSGAETRRRTDDRAR